MSDTDIALCMWVISGSFGVASSNTTQVYRYSCIDVVKVKDTLIVTHLNV